MWWLLSAWIAGEFVLLCDDSQALAGLALLVCLWGSRAVRHSPLAPLLLILAGVLLSQVFLARGLAGWLPTSLSGTQLVVTGQVADLPVERLNAIDGSISTSFLLKNTRLLNAPERWPGGHLIRLHDSTGQHFRPGDLLRLRVTLYRPRGLVNVGSSDGARKALARGQDASGGVKNLLKQAPGFAPVDLLRARISERIRARLTAWPKAAGLIPALVVGDWRFLSAPSWALYRNSGVAHLVVISGEHLTLVAGFVWLLLRYICVPLLWWRRWTISAQQFALLPAFVVALGYCLLAGWSVSTLRALLMLAVWFYCRLFRRRWPRHRVFSTALLVVLLWRPLAPLGEGFWLSFVAVGLLLLVADRRAGLISLQCLMSLALGALAGFMFSHWGTAGLVANLVLILLFSFVLVPAALLGSLVPGLGFLLLWIAPLIHLQELFLARLLDWAPLLPVPANWLTSLLLMLALLLVWARFLPWPRLALPFLVLPWLFPWVARLAPGDFELQVFDVGQGEASLVRTRAGLVLYDFGPVWSTSSAGSRVLRPWLDKQRAPILLAFASHGDDDHVGGLPAVANLIPAQQLFSGEPWRVSGSKACHIGQFWRFSGVDFQVIWPPAKQRLASDNAYSCVVRVSGRHGSLLLTGDIPRQVEYWLVAHQALSADVLQLPHHGSATSSSYAFLRAVAPQLAYADVGFMNQFGHPSAVVRHKLRQLGIPLLRTDLDGMLRLLFDKHGLHVRRLRDRRRPWEATNERRRRLLQQLTTIKENK